MSRVSLGGLTKRLLNNAYDIDDVNLQVQF
ncbi:hypothetical protein J2S16_004823 [Cytobacillus kochii]|nr:hypothetical protein [Cytobacillus kochii]